jgi:two-component system cell cycle response regulator
MTARILVVDDIPANVRLLEAKLMAEYFEVLTASDGPSALEVANTQAPDLILLDVMMPGMDGFEVAERLKAEPKTRHIPIVMITALTDTADRVRGLEAGADDFLSKPVNDIALFARVRSLARLKVMMDELRVRNATTGEMDISGEAPQDAEEDAANGQILMVESGDLLAERLSQCLTAAGHRVQRVSNGAEALELGRQPGLDLIMVSLSLAGEDGLRLCSQFRSHDETRHVPILLILDEADLAQLAKGLELGVTDYLIRPIDQNELLARTRTQIRRRRYHDKLHQMLDNSVSLAYTDALTGTYNRRYMNAHLDRKIMEVANTQKPVSVMIFDIDHFKRVNDDYGHASGDEVLKAMADLRYRPLQAGQRRLRPCQRRRGSQGHGPAGDRQHPRFRSAGALRRRGVRGDHAEHPGRHLLDGGRAPVSQDRGGALRGFRQRNAARYHRLDRRRHDHRSHGDRGCPVGARRCRTL